MSALRLQHDLHKLDAQIARVLARAARTGVAASAVGSPLGDALDALAECQRVLREGGFADVVAISSQPSIHRGGDRAMPGQ